MHDHEAEIRCLNHVLAAVEAALRRRAAACAALWAGGAAAAGLTILLVADAAADFGPGVRPAVYLIAVVAAAAGIGLAAWAAGRRRPSPLYLARLIEGRRPELKNSLLTYVELRCAQGGDPSMCAAVGRRAGRILQDADPAEFVPQGSLRPATVAATASACVLTAAIWLAQGVVFHHWTASAQASPGARGRAGTAIPAAVVPGGLAEAAAGAVGGPLSEGAAPELAAAILADGEKLERLAAALGQQSPGLSPGQGGQGTGRAESAAGSGNAAGGGGSAEGAGGATESAAGGGNTAGGGSTQGGGAAESAAGGGATESAAGGKAAGGGATQGGGAAESAGSGGATESAPGGGRADPDGGGSPGRPPPGRATAPPLTPRPQPTNFPEKTLDAMRRIKRLIDGADERLRDGEVTDGFLGRMGMSNADFRRFVAAWQRKLEQAAPEAALSPPASLVPGAAPARGDLIGGGSGPDARPITGPDPSASDGRHGAVEGAEGQVSPRLRPAVAAYFETVGKLAAESGPKDVPK